MAEASLQFNYKRNRALFEKTFAELRAALPDGIKRGNRRITPVNLFEAVSVGAAMAVSKDIALQNSGVEVWIHDEELTRLTSEASNDRKRVHARIEYCFNKFSL